MPTQINLKTQQQDRRCMKPPAWLPAQNHWRWAAATASIYCSAAVFHPHLDLLLQELLEAGNLHDLIIDWLAAVDGEGDGLGLLCGRLGLLHDGHSHLNRLSQDNEGGSRAGKDRAQRCAAALPVSQLVGFYERA